MIVFFDLDGTVIDSSHRKATLPCGALDLDHWRANSTPEKIAADSLLPLAKVWRKAYRAGYTIGISTARVMSCHDWQFLNDSGLPFHYAWSRGLFRGSDSELKQKHFYNAFHKLEIPFHKMLLLDDNSSVLEMASGLGMRAIDAIAANQRLLKGDAAL